MVWSSASAPPRPAADSATSRQPGIAITVWPRGYAGVGPSGWAMVKITGRQGQPVKNPGQLQAGMVWGFVPVDLLTV